jgi:GNAT superfamily N-acetyltransferase
MSTFTLTWLDATTVTAALPHLEAVLCDAVESGASIGFMLPLDRSEITDYWAGIAQAVIDEKKYLLVAVNEQGEMVGTAQLEPAGKSNGRHRAEVQKVIVLARCRQQGIGKLLMQEVDRFAASIGRTLLLLDTRANDAGEKLYASVGWTQFGAVPRYAYSPDGSMEGTTFWYKTL